MGSSFGDGTSDGAQLCCCPCNGAERANYTNERLIPSYTGDLPAPLQVASWIPRSIGQVVYISDSNVRGYVRRAANYHGILYAAIAAILQLENAPTASKWQQFSCKRASGRCKGWQTGLTMSRATLWAWVLTIFHGCPAMWMIRSGVSHEGLRV
ncbi:hypothetical protein SAMN04488002_1074 [Litoreibacter janthinus]|uniref:Uncharacterized protein n=1 Tax=Litoreibacter janthinus TaxID=670154 RepID=A0A1I6G8U1_9RHOB|nr:hypothetical protein SAMN04488002_1074 [Litoreibacter janthinus]